MKDDLRSFVSAAVEEANAEFETGEPKTEEQATEGQSETKIENTEAAGENSSDNASDNEGVKDGANSQQTEQKKEDEKFNPLAYINETLGQEFKDEDSFKNAFAELGKERPEPNHLEKLNETLGTSFGDMEALKLALDKTPEFASEEIALMDAAARQGMSIDAFTRLNGVDTNTLSSLDALALKTKIENPKIGSLSEIKEHFRTKYEEFEDGESEPMGLRIDGNNAKNSLNEMKSKIKPVDYTAIKEAKQAEIEKQRKVYEAGWKTIQESMNKELSEFKIDVGNGLELIAKPSEHSKLINSVVENMLGQQPTKESIGFAYDYVKKTIISDNLSEMVKTLVDSQLTKAKEDWHREVDNPGSTNDGKEGSAPPKKEDWEVERDKTEAAVRKRLDL